MTSPGEDRPAARLAATIAHLHGLGLTDRDAHIALLRAILESQPATNGVWCVWEPDALDGRDSDFRNAPGHDATGRFVPHWNRTRGYPKLLPVTRYEERRFGTWYWVPKQRAQLCAVDPYLYLIDNRIHTITSEVAPIITNGRCLGVVGFDHLARSNRPRATDITASPRVRPLAGPDRLAALTAREREVHFWLTEGKSNDEIAIVLGISPHTVRHHLEHIFDKLGVGNRYAAITGHD